MRAWLIVAVLASACATRARPYRFAAPMVAGAELSDPIWSRRGDAQPAAHPATRAELPPRRDPRRDPRAPAPPDVPPDAALTPTAAFALAGVRDHRDPLAFALDLRARLTGDRLAAADGPALVDDARARGALVDAPRAYDLHAGALLVFDRAVARAPASLVAVVLAVDDRGVVAIAFLGAGVVRIGYVDPAHPHDKRDPDGRVRNTFLRHRDEEPPAGTHFLAGEDLAHAID